MDEEDELPSYVKKGKKVLIAMDGSKHLVEAFEWYVQNLHKSEDVVVLAYSAKHVRRSSSKEHHSSSKQDHHRLSGSTSTEEDRDPESQEEQTKRIFRSIEKLATRHRIRHILHLLHEPVGESVVKAAKQQNVDMIIAGGRQHGKFGLGNTCNFITRYSHIPVMIYKYTDETDTDTDHMREYQRSRSESFGEKIKARWRKENDHTTDHHRQRSQSFSERVKSIMKMN